MPGNIKLDDNVYEIDNLSENAKKLVSLIQFSEQKIQDAQNTRALLHAAKNSYIAGLKSEVLSAKSGFSFED